MNCTTHHHISIQIKAMATFNFQTQNSFSVLLSISLTLFLLLLSKVNSTQTVSFSFTKFVPNQQDLIFQGDALVTSTGDLQLTKLENGKAVANSVGRALYAAPIHIWDSTTGKVASFVTSFSFVINAANSGDIGDGLAFFLAPVDTLPQTAGGLLGLFKNSNIEKSNQIVAVEIDTFGNTAWDPQGQHIGIDVNSINSIKTASWKLESGQVANVVISYEASTKSLTASLVYPSLRKSYIINDIVDVKDVLPEWVRVGFSSATGFNVEIHDVLSWSFESKLPDSNSDALENNAHLSSYVVHDSM